MIPDDRQRPGPVRVLQVVEKLDRGGVETWLMNVLRHIDRDALHLDFLVHNPDPGAYDAEARALGATIIYCHRPGDPIRYARNLLGALREFGPYDVVHGHLQYFNGLVMAVARLAGVPRRISHSHLDTRPMDRDAGARRRLYTGTMKVLNRTLATDRLATSTDAAISLFGPGWSSLDRTRVLHCGIDLSRFRSATGAAVGREELGFRDGELVVGHVGRFDAQKNHAFLVDAFAEVLRTVPDAKLLLVGDGALRPSVERQVVRLGLEDHVVFAGGRSDVPGILSSVIDVFAFPSRFEGLGIALVEAQVAGVPCVVSDAIPAEAVQVDSLVTRVPLAAGEAAWAEAIVRGARAARSAAHRPGVESFAGTSFDIERSARELTAIYSPALDQHVPATPDDPFGAPPVLNGAVTPRSDDVSWQ